MRLYKKYGTCLKGMMAEKILDDNSVDEYLLWAHDVPLENTSGGRKTERCLAK